MSEQMRTKIIAGFLFAALIWAGFSYKSESKKTPDAALQTIQALDSGVQTYKIKNNYINIKKYDTLSWGRSPFYLSSLSSLKRPQVTGKNETLSWILSGIVFNSKSPTAIINKRPVKIGDTIDKALVTQIDKKKVIIKYNQEIITLTVSKG